MDDLLRRVLDEAQRHHAVPIVLVYGPRDGEVTVVQWPLPEVFRYRVASHPAATIVSCEYAIERDAERNPVLSADGQVRYIWRGASEGAGRD